MNQTLFSRGVSTQLEGWKAALQINGTNYQNFARGVSVRIGDSSRPYTTFQRASPAWQTETFYTMTREESEDYAQMTRALIPITSAPKHMALYLYLTKHQKLDAFVKAFKGENND
jgi:hypothetical protein